MSPPNPPPTKAEEDRFRVDHNQPDPMVIGGPTLAAIWRSSVYLASAIEISYLLPSVFPSVPLLPLLQPPHYEVHISNETVLGFLIFLLATFLRLHCYARLARNFTYELSLREDQKLITDGVYSIVRHPSYTAITGLFIGNLLINYGRGSWWWNLFVLGFSSETQAGTTSVPIVGFTVLGSLQLLFLFCMPYIFAKRCVAEDRVLEQHFGQQWVRWKTRVPCRLVPGVW
ncbi:hypothetical protein BC835DRAFT_1421383 [Cytidiella melzeri]|nr:hypothetical protein BC835DRAFT_1421383 [Cytidiella melzeri]